MVTREEGAEAGGLDGLHGVEKAERYGGEKYAEG